MIIHVKLKNTIFYEKQEKISPSANLIRSKSNADLYFSLMNSCNKSGRKTSSIAAPENGCRIRMKVRVVHDAMLGSLHIYRVAR